MSVNPVPTNEKDRLSALKNYNLFNALNGHEFDRIARLAALICGTPVSLISFIDENRQWYKSKIGIDVNELPRELTFCQHTIMGDGLLEVENTLLDGRFKNHPLVTGSPHIRFYAGYPLTDPDGYNLGTICVTDQKPRLLTSDQREALELLTQEVMGLIEEHQRKEELGNLEKLFSVSNDLICVVGAEGYFKKINPAFESVLGWEEAYVLKSMANILVHPDDLAYTQKELAKLYTTETTISNTHRAKTRDGDYKTIQWLTTIERATGNLFCIGRDITNQIQKEQQLVESEAKLRAFFENAQGLICTHDLKGRLLSVNPVGAELLGYKPEEIFAMSLFDLIPESYHDHLQSYLKEIKTTGHAKGQMPTMDKKGSLKTWTFSNIMERDNNGIAYVIANAIDITEQHHLESKLNYTRQMLERTNEMARVGGYEADLVKQTVYWTSVTKQIHGVGSDYVPNLETGINFYKEGESRNKISQALAKSLEDGSSYDLEVQIVNAQGQDVWVRVIGTAELEDGVYKRLFGTFQDIDEKKKAQLEINRSRAILTAFVEHAPASVAMLDNNMCYIAASNRWREDYLLVDRQLVGESYYAVFPFLTQQAKERHQRILNGAIEHKDEDQLLLEGLGSDKYFAWEMRPWYQFDGSIGGIMVFTQDVTPLVKQREELKTAKLQAEAASVAKSEFLANMSHEIRTPLNGVIGFTDLVLKTNLTDTQQQYLSIVNQSANALLSIINDILDFSKIEAGKLELDIEQSDLFEMSAQATDIITYQVQKKGLEMLLNLAPDLPRFIWTDSVRLKQVIINLLSNATKFTEKGEIELKIEVLSSKDELSLIRFAVRDTGIGIQPAKQHKIFEAFSQEDSSTTKKYGGTGLGLTISNKLLGLMHSRLQLESTPGFGSTFYFDITVKTKQGELIKWDHIDRIKKVLVVDDNDNNREILNQMLLLKNIHSTTAKNGFEALQLLGEGQKFDVILMDYHMPYMNGLEVIAKIRENFYASKEEQPIILLSSSADNERLIKEVEKLQVNQRIIKPVKMQEIYTALSRLHQKTNTIETPVSSNILPETTANKADILIAEDNPVNMLLAITILKRVAPNANLIQAKNGREAVEYCKNRLPDLILMDVQMPELNGYEATQAIRKIDQAGQIPIIALTAGNVKNERGKCMDAGMSDFVTKPVIEQTIAQMISIWLPADPIPVKTVVSTASNTNANAFSHFDINVMKDHFGDEPEILEEVITLTRTELQQALLNIKTFIKGQNIKLVNQAGHKLYGTAISAGLDGIAELARTFDYATAFNKSYLEKQLDLLDKEIKLVFKLLNSQT
ncbi:MAG: PAS domain S-box protein [Janthinobacterium lividum]